MKDLLAKIRKALPVQKCQLATEVHGQVTMVLLSLKMQLNQIDQTPSNLLSSADIATFEKQLDEVEVILSELESLLSGLDIKEIKHIRQNIEKDYAEILEIWKFYEILNPDGRTYTADYDGTAEAGNHGKNSPAGTDFTGQKFTIPTLPEVFSFLRPAKMKLYLQMEKDGLEPKLQITPIALNIRTLAQKIDAKRQQLKICASDAYVWDEIKDTKLQYAPTSIKAIKGGMEIEIKGGKSKSEWIIENQGYLIDLVPTKQELEADPAIQKDQLGDVNYTPVQAERYLTKAKQAGYSPMSYESLLLAQMRAIKVGKPLHKSDFTSLLDSNLRSSHGSTMGCWSKDRVYLARCYGNNRSDLLRLRSTVRVK